jgi:hypothetical protein
VGEPDQAPTDIELVAAVALARDICLHNHVGVCGDTHRDSSPNLADSAAWKVLRGRVFPSFDLKKFQAAANQLCAQVKQELTGRAQQVA